jgi:hypothetical protein
LFHDLTPRRLPGPPSLLGRVGPVHSWTIPEAFAKIGNVQCCNLAKARGEALSMVGLSRDVDARQLAEDYWPMALKLAARVADTHPDCRDELVGNLSLELVKAAQRWDPGRGVKFSTFAMRRLQWVAWETVQAGMDWSKRRVGLDSLPDPTGRSLDPALVVAEAEGKAMDVIGAGEWPHKKPSGKRARKPVPFRH